MQLQVQLEKEDPELKRVVADREKAMKRKETTLAEEPQTDGTTAVAEYSITTFLPEKKNTRQKRMSKKNRKKKHTAREMLQKRREKLMKKAKEYLLTMYLLHVCALATKAPNMAQCEG
ncbi:hypothetical protein DVH05_026885 [Phytophthora capsici]|nr:hypothetical protein DVH05_004514 [Phytophthora capsici]KAG1691393.1 hypothetical protein DVH05_026885 [Phytophthora capsici]